MRTSPFHGSGAAGTNRNRKIPSAASAAARFGVGGAPAPRSAAWKDRLRNRLARPIGLRLLPATIFVAVLLLGVRVGDLVRAVTGTGGVPIQAVQPSLAQPAAEPAGPVAAAVRPDQPPPPPLTAATGSETGSVRADLLQRLGERREELDARARELEQREALLAAAEKSIDQKIEELTRLRAEIEGLVRKVDDQQAAQIESLVKIYESMKPKDAARIFEELDMPVLLNVVERMKESKSAPILASMDPMKAKEVTAHLAERRSLPGTVQQ